MGGRREGVDASKAGVSRDKSLSNQDAPKRATHKLTDLVAALAALDVDDLAHGCWLLRGGVANKEDLRVVVWLCDAGGETATRRPCPVADARPPHCCLALPCFMSSVFSSLFKVLGIIMK